MGISEINKIKDKKEREIQTLLWRKKHLKSVNSIVYPDGEIGYLKGNFMVFTDSH